MLFGADEAAFLAEHAGGASSNGEQSILDIIPTSLHQRTPLFIGDKDLVRLAEEYMRGEMP